MNMETHTDRRKKRLHDHSDPPDSSKHPRLDPNESEPDPARVDTVLDPDLLSMLNDAENVTERDPTVLDSVIKSFEEEILAPAPNPSAEPVVFKPNLGYLLEASDDELGLPPTVPESVAGAEGVDLRGFLGVEDDDIGNKDGFGLTGYDVEDNGGGYVTIDGLFDYSEDILWRSESLQAM